MTSRVSEGPSPVQRGRMRYIRKINTLIEGLPLLDAGSLGESGGAGAHPETREGPEHAAGAAAAEDRGSPEGPAAR